jgi:RHS repeat-associated protein
VDDYASGIFGFADALNAGNGLWKMGARFYGAGKSSFIQQDRYMGDPGDPLSLNQYVYCGLDPVNFVDPTGFWFESLADAAFLTMDVHDILSNPADGWGWASLGADLACVILPIATGGRLAVKGLEKTTVYLSKTTKGAVQYVGITNNLARRSAEHLASKGIRITELMSDLSRSDARAVEQALIEIYGLGKEGGTLMNKINSIAKSNPTYAEQLQRGYELLQTAGY